MTTTQDWLTKYALEVMGEYLSGAALADSVHPIAAPEGARTPLIVIQPVGAETLDSYAGSRVVRQDFAIHAASTMAAETRDIIDRLTATLRAGKHPCFLRGRRIGL